MEIFHISLSNAPTKSDGGYWNTAFRIFQLVENLF